MHLLSEHRPAVQKKAASHNGHERIYFISNMAEVVSQRIRNELTRLYAVVNEVANRAVVTSDDIQYFINCLEHFHRHLLRLSESGFVTAHSVRILQDALSSLRDSGMPEDLIPVSDFGHAPVSRKTLRET